MSFLRAAALAAALAIQGCASLGSGSGCDQPLATAAAPAAPAGTLSLISWNVHGLPFDETRERRLGNIAAEILRRRPDLVLLQEVWLEDDAARLGCSLAAAYERLADGPGVRSGVLNLFGHRRGGLLALVRRDSAWRPEAAEPVFEEYAASAPWYRLGELDGISGKGFQSFAIDDGARRVLVVNTHLQAQYPAQGNHHDAERLQQIRQLVAHAAKAAGAYAVLVAGDLNVREQESAHYGELAAVLHDLTAAYRHACGCGTFVDRSGADNWWIDYAFARRADGGAVGAAVERIRNRGRDDPYSDHHGLWAELELAGTAFAPLPPHTLDRGDHGTDATEQDSEQRAGNSRAW